MFVRHRIVEDECKVLLQRLEHALRQRGNHVDVVSEYACLLRNARNLSDGKRLHAHILRSGCGGDGFLGDQLVRMYSRCGSLEHARRVFDQLPRRNVFSWNIMIDAYAQRGQGDEALHLFHTMALDGEASPDGFTVATILAACSSVGAAAEGEAIHKLMSTQVGSNLVVQNSLINMYAKCGHVDIARREFDRMALTRDTVSWNCMIAAYIQQGDCNEALRLYRGMVWNGVRRTSASFATALGACTSSLGLAKEIHAHVDAAGGFQSDVVVGTALLSTYAKCGSLDDARRTFQHIQHKNVVTWTAMVEAYAQHGQPSQALELYHAMDLEGLQPNNVTFVSVVGACSDLEALGKGAQVHARINGSGLEGDVSILNALIDMYGRCNSLEDATCVFEGMRQRNVVSWNAMIMACARHGSEGKEEALHVYRKMNSEGVQQNSITFASILAACSTPGALDTGEEIHAQITARGLQSNVVVGTVLIHMYSRCGCLDDARRVFEEIKEKNIVAWTAMIAACVQHRCSKEEAFQLYHKMDWEGINPNSFTFATILGACSSSEALEEGREIHACINAAGYGSDAVLQNALVTMYANCNSLELAWDLFQRTQRKSVISWSAVIAAYARHGDARVALQLYHEMNLEGVQPNSVTFASALGACAALGALEQGKAIHARFVATGFQSVVVQNVAINLYGKCQRLEMARMVFDAMAEKDAATWNVMIAQTGDAMEALDLYERMGVQRDEITFATILGVCANAGALEAGRKVHADIVGSGLPFDASAALINMYAKCGSLDEAKGVFETIKHKSVVCWTAMIAACVQHGHGRQALGLYHSMDQKPNDFTFASILGACSSLAALDEGRAIHAGIDGLDGGGDEAVHNALLRMYANCGNLGDARWVFDRMCSRRDVAVWNTMAAAYAQHGHGRQALHIFHELSLQGMQPDGVTFACSLIGCSRAGLVNDARLYFVSMASDFGITPAVEHYVCMIDILGRAGRLEEAEDLMESMPFQPDDVARMALLSACKIHGDAQRGALVAQQLCPQDDDAPYVLISNMLRDYGI